MSEKLGIKYYEKYGGYARALREFKELDIVHLIECVSYLLWTVI